MVLTEIDSNAIMVKPMKSCKNAKMIRSYRAMMIRLKQAGIIPKKYILNNEVSENVKTMIQEEYNMQMEFVLLGCHRHNAAEDAIQNYKLHFLSVLVFPCNFGTNCCHKQK